MPRPRTGEEEQQQQVYGLMRARLLEMFGSGGSFRVVLGRADPFEAIFAETVAETIGWGTAAARLAAPVSHRATADRAYADVAYADNATAGPRRVVSTA